MAREKKETALRATAPVGAEVKLDNEFWLSTALPMADGLSLVVERKVKEFSIEIGFYQVFARNGKLTVQHNYGPVLLTVPLDALDPGPPF